MSLNLADVPGDHHASRGDPRLPTSVSRICRLREGLERQLNPSIPIQPEASIGAMTVERSKASAALRHSLGSCGEYLTEATPLDGMDRFPTLCVEVRFAFCCSPPDDSYRPASLQYAETSRDSIRSFAATILLLNWSVSASGYLRRGKHHCATRRCASSRFAN